MSKQLSPFLFPPSPGRRARGSSGGFSAPARMLLTLAAFVIVVAGMKASQELLTPFLLSAFLAIIGTPPLLWLRQRGLPSWLSLLLVLSVILLAVLVLVIGVGHSVDSFSRAVPLYQQRLHALALHFLTFFEPLGIDLSQQKFLQYLDPAAAIGLVGSLVNSLGGVLTNVFMILLTVVFLLQESVTLPGKLHAALKNPQQYLARSRRFISNVQRYLLIKTATSLATGLTVWIWLLVLKVDFAALWGVLAFFLNFVPNIGSVIAAVPAILLALVQLGASTALWVAAGFVVVNNLVGNVIEPKFLGRSLGLSTLVVFVSLVFWGWVLGPVGMFLSVPLSMLVKIAVESNEHTRWLSILLGSEVPSTTAAAADDVDLADMMGEDQQNDE